MRKYLIFRLTPSGTVFGGKVRPSAIMTIKNGAEQIRLNYLTADINCSKVLNLTGLFITWSNFSYSPILP